MDILKIMFLLWYKKNGNETGLYDYYYYLAKQYSDIYLFYKENKKIFYRAKKNKWIKDYTWLKYNSENNEKLSLVYVYEFSNKIAYVGLTKSLKSRDKRHRVRSYHSNGTPMYDGVLDYAEKNNIQVPQPKILIDNITKDESGEQEIYWIKHYKHNGWTLLNKNKGGATGVRRINKSKWTADSVIMEAKNYKNMEEMRIKNGSAYKFMCKNNLKLKCFPDAKLQKHHSPRVYTEELIKSVIDKCETKNDLRMLDMSMYQNLFKKGTLYKYFPKGRDKNETDNRN